MMVLAYKLMDAAIFLSIVQIILLICFIVQNAMKIKKLKNLK